MTDKDIICREYRRGFKYLGNYDVYVILRCACYP